MKYRPDIDGLRAIAVLIVVFSHLGIRPGGGFIGVDVFFVISGYLISATILEEMNAGKFSIVGFYERRVRRIFPALLVMLGAVSLLVYLFFVPAEVVDYARSLLAALFSVSNFLFWHQAGYFDAPSALKPLLHTWSLAVEEQFYILFPIFLVLVRRWIPNRLKAAIWTVTGVSFALACFWVRRDATADFFFAPLRAWELLIGTVLSQHYLPSIQGRLQRNFAALAGLLLIFVPAFRYTALTPFPGLSALPPCLGAALLIAAGEFGPTVTGAVLASPVFRFFGLISYSLYLWHWPLIVFQRTNSMLVHGVQIDRRAKVVLFVVAVGVSTLSWRYVETPFRKGRFRPGRRGVFLVNGAAVALIALVGAVMLATRGVPSRFPPDALAVAAYATYDPAPAFRQGTCFIVGPEQTFADFRPSTCLADDPARRHDLLLGDSHAAQLYYGLNAVFPEINFSQATHSGCRSFAPDPADDPLNECVKMADFIYNDYLLHHRIDTVLLAGQWLVSDLPGLERTARWLQQHGIKVTVVGSTMEYDEPFPLILADALRDHNLSELAQHQVRERHAVDERIEKAMREDLKVPYISAFEDICSAQLEMVAKAQPEVGGCPLYAAPGVPILFDTGHLTPQGSVLYASAMRARNQLELNHP